MAYLGMADSLAILGIVGSIGGVVIAAIIKSKPSSSNGNNRHLDDYITKETFNTVQKATNTLWETKYTNIEQNIVDIKAWMSKLDKKIDYIIKQDNV